jgi:hypothetical protein
MIGVGIGISPSFGGFIQQDPILFTAYFSALPAGFNAAPTGVVYQCASSSRTVQTGTSTLVSGGGVDALPIGRLVSSNALGLALDGPIVNDSPLTAYGIVNGVDNGSIDFFGLSGKSFSDNSGSTAYIGDTLPTSYNTYGRRSGFYWSKTDGSKPAVWSSLRHDFNVSAASNYLQSESEIRWNCNNTAEWRRVYASILFNSLSGTMTTSTSRIYFTSAAAETLDISIGATQWVYGKIDSEYHGTTRTGAAFSVSAANSVDNGRISLELDWYPRAMSSAYGVIYIWYRDSNNYCSYNGSTSRFTVVIDGTSWSPTEQLTWGDFDYDVPYGSVSGDTITVGYGENGFITGTRRVKIWLEAGNGITKIRATVDGVLNKFSDSTVQNSITGAGATSVASNIGDVTTGQMGGHIISAKFYKSGRYPEWAFPELFCINFSQLSAGFNAAPTGVTYQCASNDRTVQTHTWSIVDGGTANQLPIGRLSHYNPLGLALDGPATNLTQGLCGDGGWTNNNVVISAAPFTPGISANSINDNSAATVGSVTYPLAVTTGDCVTSAFCFYDSLVSDHFMVFNPVSSTTANASMNKNFGRSWLRLQRTGTLNGSTLAAVFPDSSTITTGGVVTFTGSASICAQSIYAGKIGSEYHPTSRTGAAYSVSAANSIDNGRISLELDWYPRAASNVYGTIYIWYRDANNYCSYNGSTSRFTVVIDGTSWSPTETVTWTGFERKPSGTVRSTNLVEFRRVRLFVVSGNGTGKITAKVDIAANTVITGNVTQNSITGVGATSVASNIGDVTTGQMAGHIVAANFYKSGLAPEWTV